VSVRDAPLDGPAVVLDGVSIDFPLYPPSTAGLKELVTGRFRGRRGARTFRALRDVTLTVDPGEVLGIVGPNGSGKSTLLRVVAGIYEPDAGKVRTRGRISLLAGLGAGFEEHLTGIENIYLNGSILGLGRQQMRTRILEIVEFAGLAEFADQPLRTYSSGMRARLGFSIAACLEPEILLLDEILGAGDLDFADKSRRRIEEMATGRSTVLMVSHQLDAVGRMCDRVACIVGGELVALGDPESAIEVYQSHRRSGA
jgi:homopolymeric O-antigen transport system ATP-binding protein